MHISSPNQTPHQTMHPTAEATECSRPGAGLEADTKRQIFPHELRFQNHVKLVSFFSRCFCFCLFLLLGFRVAARYRNTYFKRAHCLLNTSSVLKHALCFKTEKPNTRNQLDMCANTCSQTCWWQGKILTSIQQGFQQQITIPHSSPFLLAILALHILNPSCPHNVLYWRQLRTLESVRGEFIGARAVLTTDCNLQNRRSAYLITRIHCGAQTSRKAIWLALVVWFSAELLCLDTTGL